MSTLFDPCSNLAGLKLPPQDIEVLSYSGSRKPGKLKEWLENLKVTQVNQTVATLYRALPEVLHLRTNPADRFMMLEEFWPVTQRSLEVFAKEFLQQPLLLPPAPQKAAIVSQVLQKHLLDGYSLCIRELVNERRLKQSQKDVLLHSIFRALSAMRRFFLRSYQLYTPIPAGMWFRAHALFQTAEQYELENVTVTLADATGKSIHHVYMQLLAMACIHPNQLSQSDLAITFSALDQWIKLVKLLVARTDHNECNPFLINLSQDQAPQEKTRFKSEPAHRVAELDFQLLAQQLQSESDKRDSDVIDNHVAHAAKLIPSQMPETLVQHLLDCWNNCGERQQARKSINIKAEACIGIIDCHYHLSGKVSFDQFLNPEQQEEEDDSFLSSGFEDLISSLTQNEHAKNELKSKESIFEVSIQNLSSSGYCLVFKIDLPQRIEAGELIGIRENGRRSWSIGVIRWIK